MTNESNHGHVTARADGVKARCGGPAMCRVCQREVAALAAAPQPVAPGAVDAQAGPSDEAAIERAVAWIDKRRNDYMDAHGSYDPETGGTDLSLADQEYVGELEEIAEGLRAFMPAAPVSDAAAQASQQPVAGDTYLCKAWGETDLPAVALVTGLDAVRQFLIEQWTGTNTIGWAMQDMQDEWEREGEAWAWQASFEIGGVSVQKVNDFSPAATPPSVSGIGEAAEPNAKDAERYRWLRDAESKDSRLDMGELYAVQHRPPHSDDADEGLWGAELDAAIDAALQAPATPPLEAQPQGAPVAYARRSDLARPFPHEKSMLVSFDADGDWSVPVFAAPVAVEQADAAPNRPGVYAWAAGNAFALVHVNRRPTEHSPGGVLNGSVIDSTRFYSGCPVDQWGRDGRWTLLRDFDAALQATKEGGAV